MYNFLYKCIHGCDVIGSRGKFRPYREIVEGSTPSDHIIYIMGTLIINI